MGTDIKRYNRALILVLAAWVTLYSCSVRADTTKPPGWAVASAHTAATEAAYRVANLGGNAFDAAIAVSAALSVVEPMSSGIGGGGFWLIHRAEDGFQIMIDGRERAPLKAHRDMYLDEQGNAVDGLSLNGPLAAGIPGEPAALAHIAAKYGRLDLAVSLRPAIDLAREGFAVTPRFQGMVEFRHPVFNTPARRLFLDGDQVPELGYVIRQPELAATLSAIAAEGHDGFYHGWVASTLVSELIRTGGIWSQRDLSEYHVVERMPVVGRYREARFVSAAPPSSGGIVLGHILNILQLRSAWELDRVDRTHTIVEAMRRAYRDRALYLGDPDFVAVDQTRLTSMEHANQAVEDMNAVATPSAELNPGAGRGQGEGVDTSHFSIIDDEGNRVAATLSINYPFGCGYVSSGTGVVLNNEMDDFVSKPGVANVYGLVGGKANSIAPGKRPLSSMSPTFVETDEIVAVIGTPGGSRIITMVLLAMLELLDNAERNLDNVVNLPRYHHQYLPDRITLEPGAFDQELTAGLQQKGHVLNERKRTYGDMHAVLWQKAGNRLTAASDGRGEGSAKVWQ